MNKNHFCFSQENLTGACLLLQSLVLPIPILLFFWFFFMVVWFRNSFTPCTGEESLQTFVMCVPFLNFLQVLSRFGQILLLVNFLFRTWQSLAAKLNSCHWVWSILAWLTLWFSHSYHSEEWKLRVGHPEVQENLGEWQHPCSWVSGGWTNWRQLMLKSKLGKSSRWIL